VKLQAVTFDFWGTLVDGDVTAESMASRLARLHAAVTGAGFACSMEELKAARERVEARVLSASSESYEDVGPPGRWAAVALELGIPEGLIPFEVIERAYDSITLEPLPRLMPFVADAVGLVRARGMRVGVICNTGMAGGRTLREVLRRRGLLECFDALVFSNEFGYAKPDPRIFSHMLELLGAVSPNEALHVGDVEALDIDGAHRAGMLAALYAPGVNVPGTEAEAVVRDWREFGAALDACAATT
jgi:putative hydrolase of the HAD superfamily